MACDGSGRISVQGLVVGQMGQMFDVLWGETRDCKHRKSFRQSSAQRKLPCILLAHGAY